MYYTIQIKPSFPYLSFMSTSRNALPDLFKSRSPPTGSGVLYIFLSSQLPFSFSFFPHSFTFFETPMLKTTLIRIARPLRQTYSTHPPHPVGTKETHALAEDALAQKTGTFKATLPKGDKKPAKASGGKDKPWKPIVIGTSITLGALLGGVLYYGQPNDKHDKVRKGMKC